MAPEGGEKAVDRVEVEAECRQVRSQREGIQVLKTKTAATKSDERQKLKYFSLEHSGCASFTKGHNSILV